MTTFSRDNRDEAISRFLRQQSESFLHGWKDFETFRGDDFQQALACETKSYPEYKQGWETRKRLYWK